MSVPVTTEQAERVLQRVRESLAQADSEDDQASSFLSISTAARYLRGYKTEPKAAKNMLTTHRYHRQLFADDLGTNESTYRTVWKELRKRHVFLGSLSDGDRPPSPVIIMRKKAEGFDKSDFEDYRRAFFFQLTCVAQLADRELAIEDPLLRQSGQWTLVMDMAGYSSKNSPPFSVSVETLRMFQNHFPERAKRIVILDASYAFSCLWKILSPLIDPVTRKKFLFISRSTGEEKLIEQLGPRVWESVCVDLEVGKQRSAQFLIDGGFLRPEEGSSS